MTSVTRFRFSTTTIERLSCPAGRKAIEVSDLDCPGLKMLVTRSGTRVFWFRFVRAGTKGAVRLGTFPALTVSDARQLALAARAKVERGIDPRQQDMEVDLTFAQFATVYLAYSRQTKRSHRDDASKLRVWLLPAFAHLKLRDLRRRHIEAYLTDLRKTHSPASVNRHLTLLSAMGRRAVALEYVERNWCAGIERLKEDNRRQCALTAQQAGRLLLALEQDRNTVAASAIALLLLTGVRLREGIHARVEEVQLDRRLWHLPRGKTGSRYVLLNDAAMELLSRQSSLQRGGWLFPGRLPGKPLGDVRSTFVRALSAAGLPPMRLHDLRHSFASLAVSAGRSLYDVQALLGHASPSMTTRYAHHDGSSLLAASQTVADVVEQAKAQLTR
ncbi:tyrosine-type recombinase/integrase [Vogesella fluminis]|uniref:Integrase n=1 Tax=Vogesella fluminis TaxID=1069161 RepID=A0ABQ3HEM6_9NEIS|nr:site-specific integrase [Vogesella fluminis]GHD81587.1 integrase [Vogesella fluminis]